VQVAGRTRTFPAEALVLATGGVATGGIEVGRDGLREPVLGLPIADDPGDVRYGDGAFRENPVDRAGVRVDASMRPVDTDGNVSHRNVYAAGAVLRGAVPWRELSGNGLALATGIAAAEAILSERGA
jgi:glycerol-3-phosphate dehydrogenase subunit B